MSIGPSTTEDHKAAEGKVDALSSAQDELARQLVRGASDALDLASPDARQEPAIHAAETLTDAAVGVLGQPEAALDARALVASPEALQKAVSAILARDKELRVQLAQARTREQALQSEVWKLSQTLEDERRSNLVKRLWFWATATFGLGGAVAFIVLCPAVALPLLTNALAWAATKIPALSVWLFRSLHAVTTSVIDGVSAARAELKRQDSDALKTVDAALKTATETRPEVRYFVDKARQN